MSAQPVDGSLKGKVALITGASSGIGRTIAVHFASLGARLSITGRNTSALEETAAMCKTAGTPDVLVVAGDLTVEADCERIVMKTLEYIQDIHVLVNNAGGGTFGLGVLTMSLKQFDDAINLNLRSAVHMTMLVAPHLIKTKGSIVNVSSIVSIQPFMGVLPYCVAKAGLDHFTRCAAAELAPQQVRVNCVCPGSIGSNLLSRAGLTDEQVNTFQEQTKSWHPIGRIGTQMEAAQAIAFLASDQSSFISGAVLPVDGGCLIKPVM